MSSRAPHSRAAAPYDSDGEGFGARLMAFLMRRPFDTMGYVLASAVVTAISVNALFLQTARHPAPMFGAQIIKFRDNASTASTKIAAAASASAPAASRTTPVPQPRPIAVTQIEAKPEASRAARTDAGRADPLADLINTNRRVVMVQRALSQYGYGQVKDDGLIGPDTRAAIERFEREQKLPVTGQVNDRVVRLLSTMTGRAID